MQLAVGCTQTSKSQMNPTLSTSFSSSIVSLFDDRSIYLCDIKSGSTTQQLIGHGNGVGTSGRGISSVQWSPVNEFMLVSGGYGDGCIKLWDVQNSGSTACLMTLDQEMDMERYRIKEELEYEEYVKN